MAQPASTAAYRTKSTTHSVPALSCVAGATFGTVSLIRSTDMLSQIVFAAITSLSILGYIILRPGGPDLTKTARQNQYDASVLARSSQKLLVAMATSLAGPDRTKWEEVMEDVDVCTAEFPEDVKHDIRQAGKIMAAANWVVERFENRSAVGRWYHQDSDANQIYQASKCLREISDALKGWDVVKLEALVRLFRVISAACMTCTVSVLQFQATESAAERGREVEESVSFQAGIPQPQGKEDRIVTARVHGQHTCLAPRLQLRASQR
ncbi:uncharacterized protein EI90DRAFT_3022709 [Cantharellus anzutake]|uniref:uncharacterized protein n=1 Tax=Cantharellus anzutake TaxID=1750568 RepID=UPI00190630C6|nr:uncharacterized protein EI90DRAFT_3022709 [Cantharellus anzutake]KAF8313296.1 hypothetical protein EI90DRAFT_3022709 [Cantharellus anzutake]